MATQNDNGYGKIQTFTFFFAKMYGDFYQLIVDRLLAYDLSFGHVH